MPPHSSTAVTESQVFTGDTASSSLIAISDRTFQQSSGSLVKS